MSFNKHESKALIGMWIGVVFFLFWLGDCLPHTHP